LAVLLLAAALPLTAPALLLQQLQRTAVPAAAAGWRLGVQALLLLLLLQLLRMAVQ
jgi:hypothetical protein